MISRILAGLVLTSGLMFGAVAHAQSTTSAARPVPVSPRAVPELDPAALGVGLMLLAGGLLVLNERRRKRE